MRSFASYQCGDVEKATRHAEQAADIAKELKPWNLANSKQILAVFYDLQYRSEDALASAREAVSIYRESRGERHRDHVQAVAGLSYFLAEAGDFKTAQEMLDSALALIGDDTSRTFDLARASIHESQARLYMHTGREADAPEQYRQVIKLLENWPQIPTGSLAIVYYRLAWAEATANGKYASAERYLAWAAKVFEQYWTRQQSVCKKNWKVSGVPILVWSIQEDSDRSLFGVVQDWLIRTFSSLAAIQHRQAKTDEAMKTLRRLLKMVPLEALNAQNENGDREYLKSVLERKGFF